jgi:hypothetical protein
MQQCASRVVFDQLMPPDKDRGDLQLVGVA